MKPGPDNLNMRTVSEGYVKFTVQHTMSPAIEITHWKELNDARTKLRKSGLIGVNSTGVGFGNLSIRFRGTEFLISGTATGAVPVLSPDEYCVVSSFDIARNFVVSSGPIEPSSESMTHGAVYSCSPGANCVIHIHSRAIFDGMIRDNYPATPESAAYGTPEIAIALGKCVQETGKGEGVIVMAGHDEGVIAYGPVIERTFILIQELYNRYGG